MSSDIEQEEFKQGISQFIFSWMFHLRKMGVDQDVVYNKPLGWVRGLCDSIEEQMEKEKKE